MVNKGERVLQADDLIKGFKSVSSVNVISFEVLRGEVLGLLGPNGARKSNTIDLITTLICGLLGSFGFLEILLHPVLGDLPDQLIRDGLIQRELDCPF
jgi:ABC-2 type transport system ATP-binding protein